MFYAMLGEIEENPTPEQRLRAMILDAELESGPPQKQKANAACWMIVFQGNSIAKPGLKKDEDAIVEMFFGKGEHRIILSPQCSRRTIPSQPSPTVVGETSQPGLFHTAKRRNGVGVG
jgi:hypothetical protein